MKCRFETSSVMSALWGMVLPRCETDNLQKRGQAPHTCPTVLDIGIEPASALHHQFRNSKLGVKVKVVQ